MMRYLAQEEKVRSRALYEEMFGEDGQAFIDAYYQYKGACNEILVLEEQGELISMVHLNPYRFWMGGDPVDVSYVVAVATRPAYRGRGCMRRLLTKALGDLYEKRQPFTFLMPADEAIYMPFDFRPMKNEDGAAWAKASVERLREQFDLFVWKDEEYQRQHISGVEWETTPMMVRIVHLPGLLEKIGADVDEPISVGIRIRDEILPGNAGVYNWVLEKEGSHLEQPGGEAEVTVSIAELGSFLFGAKRAAEVFADVPARTLAKLEKIRVFRKKFVNEVV